MMRNWFHRLLLSYLPAFFIICLSLLLMTYLTIGEIFKNSVNKANEALAHNVMLLIDETLVGVETIMLNEIQSNEKLKLFFSEKTAEERRYADIQTASALKELVNKYPIIDSIYLYRTTDETVLTPATLTSLKSFADRQYLGLMVSSFQPYRWTIRTPVLYEQTGSHQGERVISLVKIANLYDSSIMVVNIKPERLLTLMRNMVYTKTTFVEMGDEHGSIIVSTDSDGSADTGPRPSKYTQGKVSSEARSALTGWTFRSGNHGGAFIEFVSSLFYVWMGLGFAIVLAGLVWMVYISRRNYKPIRSLIERIVKVRPIVPDRNEPVKIDEFRLIETTIEELLDESNVLQEQHQKNMVYRRRYLFLNMMEEAADSRPKSWLEEMKQLGFGSPDSRIVVALAEIDHYAEFDRQYAGDQHLLKHVLSKVVQEMAEDKPYTVWAEWIDHCRLAVLAIFLEQEDGESAMANFCESLRQWVEENLDFTITIGIGRHADGVAHTSESFREAVAAIGFKSSLGYNRIIEPVHVISRPKGELFKQLQCIRAVSQSFRSGDKEWEAHYEDMYGNLQDQLFSHDDLSNLMQVLIGHLQKEMAELPEEMYNVWSGGVHEALMNAVRRSEAMDDMFSEIRVILQAAQLRMSELRESKSTHQLVQQMKIYISGNSHNPDLSLTHLSEEFGLNAKYLSKLFREAFGVKFVEYVTSVRMEKAEQLLRETEHTIQYIGNSVGYEQSLTFIRVFKKHTGLTPGQYRKLKTQL